MKKTAALLMVLMLLTGFSFAGRADSCRCGTKLVTTGDTKAEVLQKCGPPTWVEERKEERLERLYGDSSYHRDGTVRKPLYATVEVNVEEWFYNFGSNRFVQIFIFENSKLVAIETGGYGYEEESPDEE